MPCHQFPQACPAPLDFYPLHSSQADADKLSCWEFYLQAPQALLAMAAAHLCCSLLLPTQPTPLVKNSKNSVPRGVAMCLHTCLQGNQADQQLIAWVHALVFF